MMKTNRINKNRKAKATYLQNEDIVNEEPTNGLAKSILLLVEGETEEIYFNKLKQNSVLNNSLAGVAVEIVGNIGKAKQIARTKQSDYTRIWIVADNDKRNAFVLEEKDVPFFNRLSNEQLPNEIILKLRAAYNSDLHNYFLSVYDYLQWLKMAIGKDETIEFWDKIQHLTTLKNREIEDFHKEFIQNKNHKIHLAYSCIAFEFWLVLHFEQNNTSFLWVDKEKDTNIDVFAYFKTICKDYEKGYYKDNGKKKEKCTAYSCLFLDWEKTHQTIQDEWDVLVRIFYACKNTKWLQQTMLPTLNRQSGKWYEVNPYIFGMDSLLIELLNIKPLRLPIYYFGLSIEFDFKNDTCQLEIRIDVEDGYPFVINDNHKHCFEIKNSGKSSFLPLIKAPLEFPNEKQLVNLHYNIPKKERVNLVLIFKDPRQHSKSSQLFVLLN